MTTTQLCVLGGLLAAAGSAAMAGINVGPALLLAGLVVSGSAIWREFQP